MSSSWRLTALLAICCVSGFGCKTIAQPADVAREPATAPAAAPEPAPPAPAAAAPAVPAPSQPPAAAPAPAAAAPTPAVAPPAAVPAPAPPAPAPTLALEIKVGLANFRATPGTSGKILAVLAKGTRLTALEERDRWFRVRLDDGREGWVAASVVTPRP